MTKDAMTKQPGLRAGSLAGQDLSLLKAGDLLLLDGQPVRFRNVFMGGIRADDGSGTRISALPPARFDFVERPASSAVEPAPEAVSSEGAGRSWNDVIQSDDFKALASHTPEQPDAETVSRLEGKFEPEAKESATPTEAALCSIAVSMKRIAAVLEGGSPDRMTILELIADRMPSHV